MIEIKMYGYYNKGQFNEIMNLFDKQHTSDAVYNKKVLLFLEAGAYLVKYDKDGNFTVRHF